MKFLLPLLSLFGLCPIRFFCGIDGEEGGGSAGGETLTPVQKLENAEARVAELESAAEEQMTQVSALETQVEELNTRAEAAEARVSELEGQISGLETQRDEAITAREEAETARDEATQRAERAEGILAADPRFANVGGEGEAPPAGGEGEGATGDEAFLAAYKAETNPAKRRKMYKAHMKAKAEAEA